MCAVRSVATPLAFKELGLRKDSGQDHCEMHLSKDSVHRIERCMSGHEILSSRNDRSETFCPELIIYQLADSILL